MKRNIMYVCMPIKLSIISHMMPKIIVRSLCEKSEITTKREASKFLASLVNMLLDLETIVTEFISFVLGLGSKDLLT